MNINDLLDLPKELKALVASYYTSSDPELINRLLPMVCLHPSSHLLLADASTSYDYSTKITNGDPDISEDEYQRLVSFRQLFADRKIAPTDQYSFIRMLQSQQIACASINKVVLMCSHKVDVKDLDKYRS